MLDTLLACDWAVVEFSMGLYNVPRGEQAAIREQNRRLHGALRENLLPLDRKATSQAGVNSHRGRSGKVSRLSRKACRNTNRLS
jgi:hypothetical protein